MGQYWLVTCPERREYAMAVFSMKLGEMLFSSWPENLVIYLINPPLCSDEETNTSVSTVSHNSSHRHSLHLSQSSVQTATKKKAVFTHQSNQDRIQKSYARRREHLLCSSSVQLATDGVKTESKS